MDGYMKAMDVVDALDIWLRARGSSQEERAMHALARALVDAIEAVTALESD